MECVRDDQECVEQAARQLYIGNTGTVEFNLNLPTEGTGGTSIGWESGDERWIGTDGTVHQPDYGYGDRVVTLTATISKGRARAQRTFEVNILQKPNEIKVKHVYPITLTVQRGRGYHLPMFTAVLTRDDEMVSQRVNWDEGVEQRATALGEQRFSGTIDGSAIAVEASVTVVADDPDAPVDAAPKLRPIGLEHVRLSGHGILAANQRRRIEFLKTLDDDQLLVEFRKAAGLDTKGADPMIGWDAPDSLLRGHTTGHVLSAYALAYGASGDGALRDKLTYLVHGLAEVQRAFGDSGRAKPGFLSAYDEGQFDKLEHYAPYPTIWAPYYTLHKILAGLLDAHRYAGSGEALAVASDLGDWVYERLHALPHEQLQNMWSMYIAGEFGGMNESLAKLYAVTGKREHLAAARLFDNDRLMVPMRQQVDALGGLHANQHIPQVIGSVELFRQTGLPYYLEQARFFMDSVIGSHIYAMGGTGQGEMFQQPGVIGALLKDNTAESCASYNMLKLANELYEYDPDPAYADYNELTTLNHIAASTDHVPQGGSLYFFPTQPGGRKEFDEENSCCHGTGLESHFYYANGAFYIDQTTLYIQQYLSCILNDEQDGVNLSVEAADRHPERVVVHLGEVSRRMLALRIPGWSHGQVTVAVNGKQLPTGRFKVSSSHVVLAVEDCDLSSWDGASVELGFQTGFRLLPTPDKPALAALAWGPYVLAALSGSGEIQHLQLDRARLEREFTREREELIFTHRATGLRFKPLALIDHEQYHTYVEIQ
ncbi:beta-L-arabinofuranosidase domain-containing protein [Bifidobacterium xylocopae]|uniref:Glycosyl hydrolase n=1 Tax=Bifidobacterium xylocopae TaxID=2493119 RepID=A0A366KCR5_9BIFI|nr:beta-L-arabinofuranosidase domain-containing protein [Bifidobacterium xylocopae]RBP99157.1 hypothetical protein CRD59_05190 [Bifidobacterium xylocopae]